MSQNLSQRPIPHHVSITLSAVELVLRGAARAEGAIEDPRLGPNRGAFVERVQRAGGGRPGEAWCAYDVYDVGHGMLGERWPLPRTGSCVQLYEAGRRLGIVHDRPAPGAVFLLWLPVASEHAHRYAHTGFCVGPDATDARRWETLEGNTNPAGGREGYGVFRRRGEHARQWGARDVFLYWWEALR